MPGYSGTVSFFDEMYKTGWIRRSADGYGKATDRASHIWETDVHERPIAAVCGEELPEGDANVVVQGDGVCLELVDCAACRLDWPILHLSHLEDRLDDYLAAMKGRKIDRAKGGKEAK